MMSRINSWAVLLAVMAAGGGEGRAQFSITGLANKSYPGYQDQVTFTINPQAGYNYAALLDGQPVAVGTPVTVAKADYHELRVWGTNQTSGTVTNQLWQFIVRPTERESTECGLPPHVPYPVINSATNEFAGAALRILAPAQYPVGMETPVVIWLVDAEGHAVRVNGQVSISGNAPIGIKRGVGSGFLAAVAQAGAVDYEFQIAGLRTNKTVLFESGTVWTPVGGLLSANTAWPANSRILVTNHLMVPLGGALSIGEGSIVLLNPLMDITNHGAISINGTVEQMVVFTPLTRTQYWGGFIQHTNNTSLAATGTIFTGAGGYPGYWFGGHGHDPSLSGISSHRAEQALISLVGANCNLTLVDSAAMHLYGQLGHSKSGTGASYRIEMTRFLMHRTTTGGEYTGAQFIVNDSAFIECPDDSAGYADGDNDGLYITDSRAGFPHGFTNTLFGWTKDDGIDSGGSGAGTLIFDRCWFEAIFHEANSLSGTENASPHADKDVRHYNDVFLNCGQAIESGYGAPTGRLERCFVTDCQTGGRFGDNYDWSYYGFLWATNSILIHNHRDVWGMNFDDWTYRTNNMDVRSNWLTAANAIHPENQIWNASTDGWRLADYRQTAPGFVGLAFAVRTNQLPLRAIQDGIPVRLSVFSTSTVQVAYAFTSNGQPLTNGTLTFAPGQMTQVIYADAESWNDNGQVALVLSAPVEAELTGLSELLLVDVQPAVSFAVTNRQADMDTLTNGVGLRLSGPPARAVQVNVQADGPAGVLTNFVAAFSAGETNLTLWLPSVVAANADLVRVTLSQPVHASLSGFSALHYLKMPKTGTNATVLGRGSWWNYFDQGIEPPAGWKGLDYSTNGWGYGRAELGYGDGDETTTITRTNAVNGKVHAAYFRQLVVLNPGTAFSALNCWLKYDDGAVVYLNSNAVFRVRMSNDPIGYLSWATGGSENSITNFVLSGALLRPGTNVVAVEVHQDDASSSDISFDFEIIGTVAAPLRVELGRISADRLLYWTSDAAVLQAATNLPGPWINVPTNSPLQLPLFGEKQFYRLSRE